MTYKVGWAVMATAAITGASSSIVGATVRAAIEGVLAFLGAPEARDVLPSYATSAGQDVVNLYAALLFIAGACMVSGRLLGELLGLGGRSQRIERLRDKDKVASGAAPAGSSYLWLEESHR